MNRLPLRFARLLWLIAALGLSGQAIPQVVLSGTHVLISGTKILYTTAGSGGAATPIMFQHIASSTNPIGNGITGHNFVIKTESLPANTVAVLAVSAPVAAASVTVSDTLVGSWAASLCTASGGSGNYKAVLFAQSLGATPGSDTITLNIGTTSRQPVQFDVTFWQNINTTTPTGGSLCTGAITPTSGGVIGPGSFTPTNNNANGGNIVWNYTALCSSAASNSSNWTPATGFSLLNGEIIWVTGQGFPEASQYELQATAASVTPSLTATGENATGDCFNSASVALAVANNSATAPSTIHVAKIIHESWASLSSPGTAVVQFPTVGNLRVLNLWTDGCPGQGAGCVSTITSSDSCNFTIYQPGGAGTDKYAVAQNCSPCPTCTVTLTFTGTQAMPQASFRMFDIQNAAASSYQNGASGDNSCSTTVTAAPSITPTGASSGLAIAELYNGTGPVTALASGAPAGTFDLWTFTGQTDSDVADNADGLAHYYFASTAAQSWNWTKAVGGDFCTWAAAVFN